MKPILFNTEMVKAILDGRKTQTRRVIKPQPICFTGRNFVFADDECPKKWEQCEDFLSTAPYRPGDELWVRETWARNPCLFEKWRYIYRADCHPADVADQKWRPSIHMPREAARIFLRVTDVKVERLQDITAKDAQAEGCDGLQHCNPLLGCAETIYNFKRIWDCTIKPADRDLYGWAANPWVWVYTFERIEKGE